MLTVCLMTTVGNVRGVPATARPISQASAPTDGIAGSKQVAERLSLAPPVGQGRNSKATVLGERLTTQDHKEQRPVQHPATWDVVAHGKAGYGHTTTRCQNALRDKHLDNVAVASPRRAEARIVRNTTKGHRRVKENAPASGNVPVISYQGKGKDMNYSGTVVTAITIRIVGCRETSTV